MTRFFQYLDFGIQALFVLLMAALPLAANGDWEFTLLTVLLVYAFLGIWQVFSMLVNLWLGHTSVARRRYVRLALPYLLLFAACLVGLYMQSSGFGSRNEGMLRITGIWVAVGVPLAAYYVWITWCELRRGNAGSAAA